MCEEEDVGAGVKVLPLLLREEFGVSTSMTTRNGVTRFNVVLFLVGQNRGTVPVAVVGGDLGCRQTFRREGAPTSPLQTSTLPCPVPVLRLRIETKCESFTTDSHCRMWTNALQRMADPPRELAANATALYGCRHCNFTTSSRRTVDRHEESRHSFNQDVGRGHRN